MAVTKTHQFLPDVFQTETNKKFLNATVDQLVNEPQLKQVNGYIGRKLAPSTRPQIVILLKVPVVDKIINLSPVWLLKIKSPIKPVLLQLTQILLTR